MEFPKSSYVITSDIWTKLADGTHVANRGVYDVYAESVPAAVEALKADVLRQHTSYEWEDVQIVSVMTWADSNMLAYGEKADRAYKAGRYNGM